MVEIPLNSCTVLWFIVSSDKVLVKRSKLGKSSNIFVASGIKVNQHVYKKFLEETLIPEMKKLSGRKGYIFQQDGATSHTATMVIDYLEIKVPELLPPDFWPPSSPDLNPLDYGLWSILKKNVTSLKSTAWTN